MTAAFIGIAPDDPIRAVWQWRADSMTLARLQPVLERLSVIEDQPCRMGNVPYTCARTAHEQLCAPCAVRDVRAALFGEREQPPEQEMHYPNQQQEGTD